MQQLEARRVSEDLRSRVGIPYHPAAIFTRTKFQLLPVEADDH